MEQVILVDDQDNEIGTMEKIEAHRKGLLHRAFSVLLFNSKGEMLIQKRAMEKYHSAGLWTNACCSHPRPEETMQEATRRKLLQEMGINIQPEFAFKFIYKAEVGNGLIEHEYDHVFVGRYEGEPLINCKEVEDWRLEAMDKLRADVKKNPHRYTHWFRLIVGHAQLNAPVA